MLGNAIQLEQVFINLLTNARDALADADRREVHIASMEEGDTVKITLADTGTGIRPGSSSGSSIRSSTTRRSAAAPVSACRSPHRQGARARSGSKAGLGGRGLHIELPRAVAEATEEGAA